MSGIERTTRICPVNQLNPDLLRAFRDYYREHKLGDLILEAILCSETITDRQNMNRFAAWFDGNPDTVEHLGLVLTAKGLYWARAGSRSGAIAWGVDLKEVSAKSYAAWFSKESGLELNGFIGDEKGRKQFVKGRLALGPQEDARKFVAEVVEAVTKANPPPPAKRGIPWLNWLRKRD